jgi:hypothetical protein
LGKPIDATQELVAIGLCNIGNSFFHALPGSGSFSRSAVNAASGIRTPMGGLYSGEKFFFKSIEYNIINILCFMGVVRFLKIIIFIFRNFGHCSFIILYTLFLLYTEISSCGDYYCCRHIHGGNSCC